MEGFEGHAEDVWAVFSTPSQKFLRNFPGGAVVENPPLNAGDTGWSPGPGGPHMLRSNRAHAPQLLSLRSRAREPQLLSPHATTTEPARLEPMLCNTRAHRNEKPVHRSKEWPPLAATGESLHAATMTQCSH